MQQQLSKAIGSFRRVLLISVLSFYVKLIGLIKTFKFPSQSVQLATVAFGCDWLACNPRLRRYVLMIILRSHRAINMAVPFFAPSLVTFTSVNFVLWEVRTYTKFSVLHSVYSTDTANIRFDYSISLLIQMNQKSKNVENNEYMQIISLIACQ